MNRQKSQPPSCVFIQHSLMNAGECQMKLKHGMRSNIKIKGNLNQKYSKLSTFFVDKTSECFDKHLNDDVMTMMMKTNEQARAD